MPEAIPLFIAGVQTVFARAVGDRGSEKSLSFDIHPVRVSDRLFLIGDVSIVESDRRFETGILISINEEQSKPLIALEDADLLRRVEEAATHHVIYDAAASNLRQLIAMLASDVQVPFKTPEPRYSFMESEPTIRVSTTD